MKEYRASIIQSVMMTLLMIIPPLAYAGNIVTENDSVINRDGGSRNDLAHSLYISTGFANNLNYMGANLSQDKPLYTGTLTYSYKEELFFSVSANHLSAFNPFLAYSTVTLNYSHDVGSWFDVSIGVSRYQVNAALTDTLFNNFFYGYLSAGVDWKILYTSLSLGGVFSESSGAYLQIRNSRYFETPSFMNGKLFISFDPYINLMAGSLTETVTAEGTSIGVSTPFSKPKPSSHGTGSSTSTFFGIVEADMGIPVGFNFGRLTIEAEPGYILPAYSGTDETNPKGFTFFLNIYYKIL